MHKENILCRDAWCQYTNMNLWFARTGVKIIPSGMSHFMLIFSNYLRSMFGINNANCTCVSVLNSSSVI